MQTVPRIFVSHSHVDNIFGAKLVEDLQQTLGSEDAVWYDVQGGLSAGDVWWNKIVEEVKARPIFIVVLSPEALNSQWVSDEIAMALQQRNSLEGKIIIPVLYRPCKVSKELRRLRSTVSFLPPRTYEVAFGEVLTALRRSSLPEKGSRMNRRTVLGAGLVLGAAILTGAVYTFVSNKGGRTITAKPLPTPVAHRTPRLRWRFQTDVYMLSSLTVANGVAYIGDDTYVYAFDAKYGTLLWKSDSANGASAPDMTDPSSPTVADGLVYISSEDNNVYALDASSGILRWRYQTGKSVESTPAISNGIVYIASEDHAAYALDASHGTLLWRYQTGDMVDASPAVSNGIVYIASEDHAAYALDASYGTLLWRYQTGDAIYASPVVRNGAVYIASNDGYLYALDALHGTLIWHSQDNPTFSIPTVANGVVYASTTGNKVYALDARNGQTLWHHLTADFLTAPIITGGVIYVSSTTDGNVYALDARDGTFLWRYAIGSSLNSPPTVANNVLYVSSGDDYVYALDI
jgi:outer membrane protein assembly factor BamB